MALFPVPKHAHPDFIDPKRKPVGPVEVDKSSFLPSHIWLAGRDVSLVDNVNTPMQGSGWSLNGEGVYFDGTTTNCTVASAPIRQSPDEFSAVFVLKFYDLPAGNDVVFNNGISGSYGNGLSVWADNDDTYSGNTNCFSINLGDVLRRSATNTNSVVAGETITLVVSWAGTSNGDFIRTWVNGDYAEGFSIGSNTGTINNISSSSYRLGFANLDRYKGDIMMTAFSNKAIRSKDYARSLSLNPYQILKPAIPMMYYTAETAVGTGLKVYELPKHAHPDFIDPKRKPVGPVVVDFNHPVVPDMALIPMPYAGGFVLRDFITGEEVALPPDTVWDNEGIRTSTSFNLPSYSTPSGSEAFSFIVGFQVHNPITGIRILGEGDIGQGEWYLKLNSNTNQEWRLFKDNSGGDILVGSNFNAAGGSNSHPQDIAVSYAGGVGPATIDTTVARDSGSGGSSAYSHPATIPFNGSVRDISLRYVYFWRREVPIDVLAKLRDSPYQILKPAIPMMYYTGAGGAVTEEAAFTIAQSMGYTTLADAVAAGAIVEVNNLSTNLTGDAQAESAISAGITSDLTNLGQATGEANQSLNVSLDATNLAQATGEAQTLAAIQLNVTKQAQAIAEAQQSINFQVDVNQLAQAIAEAQTVQSINLTDAETALISIEAAASMGISLSVAKSGQADTESALLSGVDLSLGYIGQVTAFAAITENAGLSDTLTGQVVAAGSVEASVTVSQTLGSTAIAEATAEAGLSVSASLATSLIAQAAVEAGLTVGSISNVIIAGQIISGTITTPRGRTFTVKAETRFLDIEQY